MKFISYCSKTLSPAVSKFLIVAGLTVSFTSCQWGDEVDAIVQPNPDDMSIIFSDSNSVTMSTLKVDSLMTGASTRNLIGRFIDPFFGKMHSTAFVQFGTTSGGIDNALSFPENAVYDSLALSLRYDGYYYGDTTKVMKVDIHELTSDLTLKPDLTPIAAIYNYHSTPFKAAPVGTGRFYPRPYNGSKASDAKGHDVKVKLSDAMGKKLFDLIVANKITGQAQFIDVLKGLAIKAADDNYAALGFVTSNTNFRLYYHTPDEVEGVKKDSLSLNVRASYNQVNGDRKGTILAKLPDTYRAMLPSSQTGNMSFVQAGSGIMTRLDFPGLQTYKSLDYMFVNEAKLIIEPLRNSSTKQFFLPSTLGAYLADKNNDYVFSGGEPIEASSSKLITDYLNDYQYYSLDVTEFVRSMLQNEAQQSYGLLLRTSSPLLKQQEVGYTGIIDGNTIFSKSFDRLVLGDQTNTNGKIRLQIKYTNIKKQ